MGLGVLSLDVIDSNGSLAHANRTVTNDIVMGDKNRVYLLNSLHLAGLRFSSRKPILLKHIFILVFFFCDQNSGMSVFNLSKIGRFKYNN